MNTRSVISITEVHNGTPFKLWDVKPQMANKLVSIPMHFLAHLVVFGNWSRGLFWGSYLHLLLCFGSLHRKNCRRSTCTRHHETSLFVSSIVARLSVTCCFMLLFLQKTCLELMNFFLF